MAILCDSGWFLHCHDTRWGFNDLVLAMVGSRYIAGFCTATALILVTIWWGFAYYHNTIYDFFNMQASYQVFFGEIGLKVTVADTPALWQQGLSGVSSLGELEGKLFIFEKEDRYGIWMKDMLIPLDILWLDNDLKVVHIEESVTPDTYPRTFSSVQPARFVLEVNADFVKSFAITKGSVLTLPVSLKPRDLQNL